MEIKQYSSLKEALDSTMNVDKTYIFVRHALIRGAVVNPHTHLKASEHIVISSGRFTLTVGDETKDFYLDNQPTVISLPAGKPHGMRADSDIDYFVMRDAEDDTIYS